MKIGRFIAELDTLPKGYGFAYRCWSPRWGAMAYPIPLNLAVRAGYHVYLRFKNPLRDDDLSSVIESELYRRAFESGRIAERRDADNRHGGYFAR